MCVAPARARVTPSSVAGGKEGHIGRDCPVREARMQGGGGGGSQYGGGGGGGYGGGGGGGGQYGGGGDRAAPRRIGRFASFGAARSAPEGAA